MERNRPIRLVITCSIFAPRLRIISKACASRSYRHAILRMVAARRRRQVVSLDQVASESRVTERFIFVLVSLFGVLGLVLAAVGLYGLLSLHVARREREFGIRTAVGATGAQLVALVTRQGAVLLGLGFV